jgi:hypothetical protein
VSVSKVLVDGAVLSLVASIYLIITMRINPRIWLQDYPQDVQDRVPPKTEQEKRLSLILGVPFVILVVTVPLISTFSLRNQADGVSYLALLGNAFGIVFAFNLVDWLVLDWLMFCTLTPQFVVIPGTEGMAGYKDYAYHFRGFLKGTVLSAMAGAAIAGIVFLF